MGIILRSRSPNLLNRLLTIRSNRVLIAISVVQIPPIQAKVLAPRKVVDGVQPLIHQWQSSFLALTT